jgi:membrane protease YdiL (CAAX protease family)
MSFAAIYYVFLIGVFLPAICLRSYFRLKAGARFPPKPAFFRSTLITLGVIFMIAWFVWRSFGMPVFPVYAFRWKDAALGLATLLLFLCVMVPRWKYKARHERVELYRRVPQTADEMGWWIPVSISAGVAEELAYRGVLFGILIYWVPNWWAAALLCALAFALGHAIQGWVNILIIFTMSVVLQGLVRFTGTLYIAMAVHALYDIIAGFTYLRFYKSTAPEVSAAPSASVM